MPRTCRTCASPERAAIDKALATGEPLRNIAKRFVISPAALFRHKQHVAGAIAKAQARREERIGDGIFDEMRRVQHKAWELLDKAEKEGDTRAALVACREVRECLESLGEMLAKVDGVKQPKIVIQFTRDPETPSVRMPERPALDIPAREVEPDKPQSKENAQGVFEEPESEAQRREYYRRALSDVSRSVEPAPVPQGAR